VRPHQFRLFLKALPGRFADLDCVCIRFAELNFQITQTTGKLHMSRPFLVCQSRELRHYRRRFADRQSLLRRSHQSRSSRNAAPRWLYFDFSSALNSANVFLIDGK